MKKVVRIARLELSALFYSPIGWLVLIVFIIQAGNKYTESLRIYQQVLFMGRKLTELTSVIFDGGGSGLFPTIAGYLFLYIPLLTMGLMSREISSGSIKLLQSSPVKDWEIILGKFGAMMVYALVLMVVLLIMVTTAGHALAAMDWGMVFSGMSGLYLLICAYSAIGLFLSSLTSYQVLAATTTLVVLALLNYIGQIGQDIGFVRDLTYFLSLSGRIDPFISGLITTRDVLYFFTVMGLFLGLSVLKLWSSRQAASFGGKSLRYGGLAVLVLAVIYVSSRPSLTGYVDMTATKKRTLTEASQRIVKQLDHPVKITTYVNLLDMMNLWEGLPERRNIDRARFEMYQRFLPDFSLNYVYYYDHAPYDMIYKENPGLNDRQLAERTAESRDLDVEDFLAPASIRKQIDLGPEERRFVREVDYDGKKTFLRVFDDNDKFPGEQEISTALQRLISRPATVAFLTGNDERSIFKKTEDAYYIETTLRGYRGALINQGFDVIRVSGGASIPDSITSLVVADPRMVLDSVTMGYLRQYILRGGNLLVAGEPGRGQVLEPLLKELGLRLMDGEMVVKSKDNAADLLNGRLRREAVNIDKMLTPEMVEEGKVSLQGVAGLEIVDTGRYTILPLIVSDTAISWNKIRPLDSLVDEQVYRPGEGDTRGSFPLMVALTRRVRDREQRIIVSGDADFMSNKELQKYGTINGPLSMALFHWLSNGAYPIDTRRPPTADNTMRVDKQWISLLADFFLYILPALVAIWGGLLLVRRKMK